MDWSFDKEFRLPAYYFSLDTKTTEDQKGTDELVTDTYYQKYDQFERDYKKLFNIIHTKFTYNLLHQLPSSYDSLDASQTWLAYWTVHTLRLLNCQLSEDLILNVIEKINACQHPAGGYGGGPYQLAHLATSYGSVLTLVELKHPQAFSSLRKEAMYGWLKRLKTSENAFLMHEGGEIDVRGCYCATTIAKLCGFDCEELFKGTAEWIASCQTYEGGFGGAPGLEAHGGYSFCAVAALSQLNSLHLIDRKKALKWCVMRQMSSEGGFQGRTNKLVDSCYSFWVAAIIPILDADFCVSRSRILFDINGLEQYILACCQRLSPPVTNPSGGGLIDKPGKHPDPYHTCYSLSGLAVAQQYLSEKLGHQDPSIDITKIQHRVKRELPVQCDLEKVNIVYNVNQYAFKHHCETFLLDL